MNDEAFLETIRAERDSDVPRLVYSDWLEEQGDADRAELIRVQCALARLHPSDSMFAMHKQRATELLQRHRDNWLGPWPLAQVQRGFLDVSCPLYALMQLTAEHMAAPLLLDLTLSTEKPMRQDLVGLDRHPALQRVTRLALGGRFDNHFADLLYILGASYPKLDTLLLPFFPGDSLVLRALERMPALRRVHLTQRYWNNAPRDDEWQAVFQAPFLANVIELHLADQSLGPIAAAFLAQSPYLRQLRRLNLAANRIGPAGAQELAQSPILANVADLDLTGNRIRDTGLRALACSARMKNVERLRLGENEIGGPGVRALLAAEFQRLRQLALGKNFIGSSTVVAFAESPLLEQLTHLEIGEDLGNEALAALTSSPRTGRLVDLDLAGSKMTERWLCELADTAQLPVLRRLRITSSRINEDGLLALLATPLGARLRELELPMCRVSAERLRRIMTAPHLQGLRRLQVTIDASPNERNDFRRLFAPRLDC